MKQHGLHRTILLFLSIFFLLACQAASPELLIRLPSATASSAGIVTPLATATLIQPSSPTKTQTSTPTATPSPTSSPSPTVIPTTAPSTRRVVIVSIDGLRPDAIEPAQMTHLAALMQNGAFSLSAQTVFPSVTLAAHASMLSGLCPSKHGILWNEYLPELGYLQDTGLFDLAHAAGLQTVMYVGVQKLSQVIKPASLDRFVFIDDHDAALMGSVVANFPQDFGILFIHLLATDVAGHDSGWMSQHQLNTIHLADEALGMLLATLDTRNLREETLIIVTSDHGGYGREHGTDVREDMTIPWVVAGPGISPKTLASPVHTMDTAATAAFALGLPIPTEWDGVPVYEAFGLPVEKQSVQCE